MPYAFRMWRAVAVALAAALLGGCGPLDGMPTGSLADGSLAQASLTEAQLQFREGNYGKAVTYYMETVEKDASNAEAWLGLAASYDQIRRFDLADKAYAQVIALEGETAIVLNNVGYSYYLRGDITAARRKLQAAQDLSPDNRRIANNIALLDGKAVPGSAPLAQLGSATQ